MLATYPSVRARCEHVRTWLDSRIASDWLCAVFALMMRPAPKPPDDARDADDAQVAMNTDCPEDGAERVHRELLVLRARLAVAVGDDRHPALAAEQLRQVVAPPRAGAGARPAVLDRRRASAPCSGECGSPIASATSCRRAAAQAASTAEPTLSIVIEPAEIGASGRLVSPSSKRTRATGSPSASAATWAITV